MNFFRDTNKLIAFIVGIIVVVGISFGIILWSDNYATQHKKDKVEPVIELTTDKVIVETGSKFDAKEYIKVATDSNGEDIKDKIKAPELDTTNSGTYEITYSYKDGNETIKSKTLKVIVAKK